MSVRVKIGLESVSAAVAAAIDATSPALADEISKGVHTALAKYDVSQVVKEYTLEALDYEFKLHVKAAIRANVKRLSKAQLQGATQEAVAAMFKEWLLSGGLSRGMSK